MNLKQINKRLFLYVAIGIAIVAIIIIIIMVMGGGGTLSYEKIEERLKIGAISYYKDHSDLLPKVAGQKATVSAFDLEQGDYIRPLQKMVKGNAICSGKVEVTKNGEDYLYSTYLNCGNDYNSAVLYSVITSQNNVVTTGDGLYNMNGEFVFRGEKVNNYVEFADKIWRIIKVDKTNNIKLLNEGEKLKQAWDDRYNIERNNKTGINNYKISRVKDYLMAAFNDEENFSSTERSNIVYKDICIGKRKNDAIINDNSIECAAVLESQPISLLQVNEYINASIDPNCRKVLDSQCQNYNYLTIYESSWWSLTGDETNTYKVYKLSSSGLEESSASVLAVVRPVIYLSDAVMFSGGTGTAADPYIIK